jgi:hypothetical protein
MRYNDPLNNSLQARPDRAETTAPRRQRRKNCRNPVAGSRRNRLGTP